MSETVPIHISAVVGPVCVTPADGEKIHGLIAEQLRAGGKVTLSFQGVEDLTSAFLHAAVGALYREFSEDAIKAGLSFADVAPDDLFTLKRTVDRAKEYFRDPSRFETAAKSVLGDDE